MKVKEGRKTRRRRVSRGVSAILQFLSYSMGKDLVDANSSLPIQIGFLYSVITT